MLNSDLLFIFFYFHFLSRIYNKNIGKAKIKKILNNELTLRLDDVEWA